MSYRALRLPPTALAPKGKLSRAEAGRPGAECAWCGRSRGQRQLYRFTFNDEYGNVTPEQKLLCSIACYRALHGTR